MAERGTFVAFGSGAVDNEIMGMDTETAETASEPGCSKTDGWIGPTALRKEEEGGDKLFGEHAGGARLGEDEADVGQEL